MARTEQEQAGGHLVRPNTKVQAKQGSPGVGVHKYEIVAAVTDLVNDGIVAVAPIRATNRVSVSLGELHAAIDKALRTMPAGCECVPIMPEEEVPPRWATAWMDAGGGGGGSLWEPPWQPRARTTLGIASPMRRTREEM